MEKKLAELAELAATLPIWQLVNSLSCWITSCMPRWANVKRAASERLAD
jgi:hypothetical protein